MLRQLATWGVGFAEGFVCLFFNVSLILVNPPGFFFVCLLTVGP